MGISTKGVVAAVHWSRSPMLERVFDDVHRRLADHPSLSFPRQIITRPVVAGDALHQTVTPAQFEEMRRSGLLACTWCEAGRNYALPLSAVADQAAGRRLVVAASLAALPALASLASSLVLIRLRHPGDLPADPEPEADREIEVTVGDDLPAAAALLAYHLQRLALPPRPPVRLVQPAGKLT